MKLITLPCGPIMANCYFIIASDSGNCIIVDPGDADDVLHVLEENKLHPKLVLLTHGHFDHCMGAAEIHKKTGAEIYLQAEDGEMIGGDNVYISAMQNSLEPFPFSPLPEDGFALSVGDISLKVLHTPGHSKGSVCFIDEADSCIFSGDTLFFESIGRTDLHGGSMRALADSVLKKLFSLPNSYIVYPGHGAATTIAHEKEFNPLARFSSHPWFN